MGAIKHSAKELGPFDTLPFTRFHTSLLVAFPLSQQADCELVSQRFEEAIKTLFDYYPFLAGQVVRDREWQGEQESARPYKVVPNDVSDFKYLRKNVITDSFPSYAELKDARFPMRMLDGTVLSPYQDIPDHYSDDDHTPVFVIQLNFVSGGLLVNFCMMHTAMDGNGLGQVVRQFAAIMRGEKLSEIDVMAGNLDTNQALPSLPDGEPCLEVHKRMLKDPNAIDDGHPDPTVEFKWAYFDFPPAKAIELKEAASKKCPRGTWITSDDAVTALIWRAITRVRSTNLDMSLTSTMARAANLRGKLDPPLPASFLANCVVALFTDVKLSNLVNEMDLSDVAILLRQEINAVGDHFTRSYITFLRALLNRDDFTFSGKNADRDYCMSSWANWPVYGHSFGEELGKPEFVRRPRMTGMEGLGFIMPREEDGRLVLAISWTKEMMEKLSKDEELMSFAVYLE